ncbi:MULTISPECIES: LacI family DNA-binding transcriptional regulator [Cryobacterium]|uniref:LacI family DNA-binding transcriptional regulator n=1 Tax=Cryobacterium TaxID=69578 RepID=UPI001F545721|nr:MULTISPECIES: LacI family DNA-binding transcriptional regulator [Cryobacterium]
MRGNGSPATMQDVARLAGVSVKTVSNVLSGYEHVSTRMHDRVMSAVTELDYEINISARNLRSGRTKVIGLAVPELSQAYFAELADAVIRAAKAHDYTVLIEQTSTDNDEIATVAAMRRHAIDGLIFSPIALGPGDVSGLSVDFPVVVLGDWVEGSPADHITLPNTAAIRTATEHLLDLGRRRIAVVGAHPEGPVGTSALRFNGYAEALTARGLEISPELVAEVPLWHRADGAAAVTQLLSAGTDFDGVVCFNDALALGALSALQLAGLRVPEDVAVVGFDDIEDARFSSPALTTISPGREELARLAVDRVLARIEAGRDAAESVHVEVGYSLEVRASTVSPSAKPVPAAMEPLLHD